MTISPSGYHPSPLWVQSKFLSSVLLDVWPHKHTAIIATENNYNFDPLTISCLSGQAFTVVGHSVSHSLSQPAYVHLQQKVFRPCLIKIV